MPAPNFTRDDSPQPHLPARQPDSHKGDFGRALLIGGSLGMTGAISLAGMAALRTGAGLVKLAVAAPCLPIVAAFEPSYMTISLPADEEGRIAGGAIEKLQPAVETATAIACGPGLGRSADLSTLVSWLFLEAKQPVVFDADALNALAEQPEIYGKAAGPRVVTPHPGEFARLMGIPRVAEPERERLAVELSRRMGAVVLLKGHKTVITDGQRVSLNDTGNPGMATGGMGDVLTGMITALLCQGLSPYDAARLGAHLHGLAGDLAAAEIGPVGIIAHDLISLIPRAIGKGG